MRREKENVACAKWHPRNFEINSNGQVAVDTYTPIYLSDVLRDMETQYAYFLPPYVIRWHANKIPTCNRMWAVELRLRFLYDVDQSPLVTRHLPSMEQNACKNVTRLRNTSERLELGYGKMHNRRNSKVQLIRFARSRYALVYRGALR